MLQASLLAAALAVASFATTSGAMAQTAKAPTASSPAAAAQCYTGIGITLSLMGLEAWEMKNPDAVTADITKPLTVMSVGSGSPAESAQLYRGDKIVKVDGTSTIGMTIPQVIALIDSGAPGTSVTLTIQRDGGHIQRDITVKRASICP